MGEAWTASGNCKRPVPSVVEGSGEDVLRVRKNQCLDLSTNEDIRLVENDPSSKRPHLFTTPISAYWFLNSLPLAPALEVPERAQRAREKSKNLQSSMHNALLPCSFQARASPKSTEKFLTGWEVEALSLDQMGLYKLPDIEAVL